MRGGREQGDGGPARPRAGAGWSVASGRSWRAVRRTCNLLDFHASSQRPAGSQLGLLGAGSVRHLSPRRIEGAAPHGSGPRFRQLPTPPTLPGAGEESRSRSGDPRVEIYRCRDPPHPSLSPLPYLSFPSLLNFKNLYILYILYTPSGRRPAGHWFQCANPRPGEAPSCRVACRDVVWRRRPPRRTAGDAAGVGNNATRPYMSRDASGCIAWNPSSWHRRADASQPRHVRHAAALLHVLDAVPHHLPPPLHILPLRCIGVNTLSCNARAARCASTSRCIAAPPPPRRPPSSGSTTRCRGTTGSPPP